MAGDNKNSTSVIGSTNAYHRSVVTSVVIITIVIAAVLCVIYFWFRINSGTRGAMREARDIRIAMKMKAVEQYGLGGKLYEPSAGNGMSKGMEEEILKMADADGNIAQPQASDATIVQGALEKSNVQIVREMVELIHNHRMYEANAKAITTQDTMLDKSVNEVGPVG